jgi:hypothetical protein
MILFGFQWQSRSLSIFYFRLQRCNDSLLIAFVDHAQLIEFFNCKYNDAHVLVIGFCEIVLRFKFKLRLDNTPYKDCDRSHDESVEKKRVQECKQTSRQCRL